MSISQWRIAAIAAALTVLIAGTVAASTDRSAEATDQWPPIVAADARCGPPAADPIAGPGAIRVALPPAKSFTVGRIPARVWRRTPVKDLSWKLGFLSLTWMRPMAARAFADGQPEVLAALVAQIAAFHRENPDTGSENEGWDEGTAMRRLQTENCLYALTRSPELIPGMVADAEVQLDKRYYGPPRFSVHNHGLMANLQLVRAADLLHRAKWKKTALTRMAREAPKAFSPMGTSLEQSSQYQHVNAVQWAQAADLLDDSPDSRRAAATIERTVDNAYRMLAWMTQPDGNIVQFGNADERAGRPMDLGDTRSVRDDVAGFLAGRWSWTDPQTGYYTVRYGPARRAHGHNDQAGGVTFATLGVRVLVGAGRYNYNVDDPFRVYQMTPQGENVAVPEPGFLTGKPAEVVSSTVTPLRHTITLRDEMYLKPHTRTVAAEPAAMTVSDSFESTESWDQSWHLDPKWKLASRDGNKLVFTHSAGRKLTVTTTGRITRVRHGVTGGETAGWHFPSAGKKQAAYQITVRNDGPRCTTRFEVEPRGVR